MIKKIIFMMILCSTFSFSAIAADSAVKEGEQYRVLERPVDAVPRVIEFFSFYCGPCYQFAEQYPVIEGVNRILPAGEKAVKYHVSAMGKLGKELTEAWAIAMVMGKNDTVEKPLFKAVQRSRNLESLEDIKNIFANAGITPVEYENAQHSLVVKGLLAKQESAMSQFSVRGTPSFYINGRYQINNAQIKASTPDDYVKEFTRVVSELLTR